jgi:hypothetical protein
MPFGKQTPLPLKAPKEGFAEVSRWISLDRDNETFIFRKFDELAGRNLLYLQAELLILESRLAELDRLDAESDDIDVKYAAKTWEPMAQQKGANSEIRLALVAEVRAKMKEYRMSTILPK